MLLNGIFIALSAGITALLYGLYPTLSPLWALPIIIGIYVGLGALFIVLVLLIVLILPDGLPSKKRYGVYHWVIQHTLSWVLMVLGYRITLTGEENVPTDRPFLLVSNHLSNFDPLMTLAVFRKWNLGFVSKPENFKIPVIGTAMKKACFIPIDRDNPRNAVMAIKQAAELINGELGLCMAIYPEGTRNKSGKGLLPFHAGSFKIAKMARCPVVVTALRYEKRGLFTRVSVHIVGVMDEAYVAKNQTVDMSQKAVEWIEEQLDK